MEASITLRNVSKFFKKKYVLSNLTLGIEKNTFFAIIGRNGAGKSILLRVISTFMAPDAGEVFINGKDIAKSPQLAKNCIGYLPDHDIHNRWITGWENLRARAELLAIPQSRFKEICEPLIKDFNLQEVLDEYPVTYSRGAKRCLDLVLVLLSDPQILILDEPTLGLDYQNRTSLFKYLLSVKNHKTIIVASNEFIEVQTLAERWIVLDYGKIRFDGTLEKMLTRIDVPFSGEIILRKKDETLLEKIKESGNFSEVYDLDLTIRLTFERLQDFYAVLATIPAENLVGVNIQSLSIADFINRLLSDEEF